MNIENICINACINRFVYRYICIYGVSLCIYEIYVQMHAQIDVFMNACTDLFLDICAFINIHIYDCYQCIICI